MRLAVISHKLCWSVGGEMPRRYFTDGGFPLQIGAISELFDETRLVVPCETAQTLDGVSQISGNEIKIVPLAVPAGSGLRRKVSIARWLITNGPKIWREVARADAVHTPIPGDVGTIGMIAAMLLKKPLFVRHCGNWLVQRTAAEKFWKWSMEIFAGGRNVMLATGGGDRAPSEQNAQIKWIFSTSLRAAELADAQPRTPPESGHLRLVIACRQEEFKGTDIVIESLPMILKTFPNATLDVIGGGSLLEKLRERARLLGLAERVRFHGKVEQKKVVALMKTAHIFCYPTSASEGFPKVVLEALASGLPIVTTPVSVLPQLTAFGCGELIDEPSAAKLAAAVSEICSDRDRYRKMSAAAVETACRYSLEAWRDTIGAALCEAWLVDSLSQPVSQRLSSAPL